MKYLIFLLLVTGSLSADPWGKDADLVRHSTCRQEPDRCPTPFLGSIAEIGIRFHQEVISPADGPRSHFYPSSSQYTLDAMRKYGFWNGFLMGCDRLMRENPEEWVYRKCYRPGAGMVKYDPVY